MAAIPTGPHLTRSPPQELTSKQQHVNFGGHSPGHSGGDRGGTGQGRNAAWSPGTMAPLPPGSPTLVGVRAPGLGRAGQ